MSSAQLKPVLIVTAGVVCAVVAFLISNAIFGGDDTEVSKTDNNNVICINCDHRFAMSWDDPDRHRGAPRHRCHDRFGRRRGPRNLDGNLAVHARDDIPSPLPD